MKRMLIGLCALLLLLGGCDLRNRRASSDFIPATRGTAPTAPHTQQQTASTLPEPAQGAAVVKRVISSKGTYTDWKEQVWSYDYQLPFLDLAAADAAVINAEIERAYRQVVQQQLAHIEALEPITVAAVTYEVFINGDILTLLLLEQPVGSGAIYSAYNVSHTTGKRVNGEALIAQAGLTVEDFLAQVREGLETEFVSRYGRYEQSDSLTYGTQFHKTVSEENYGTDMPMYLDADGALHVIATLYCVGLIQGSERYVLRLGG